MTHRLKDFKNFTQAGITVAKIVETLCLRRPEGPFRHYLATSLSNLSQLRAVREGLLSKTSPLIENLLIFTEHSNLKRRGGTIGTIRNCCFDTANHEWLLETGTMFDNLRPKVGMSVWSAILN